MGAIRIKEFMVFFSNLFGRKKSVTFEVPELGAFEYFKDEVDEYWQIENPVGKLPEKFDFGAIDGNLNGPREDALNEFIKLARKPEVLFTYLNDLFFREIKPTFGQLSVEDVRSKFYLKSLTCSEKGKFEFGFHAIEKDVFVELFFRNGIVKEVHIDEGCCKYV
ncbi:hypothetical protein RI845_13260 [Thalassotalea nanhaiensis]|uniref:DUF2004 domain-containing protein n=1 Tax=Thalassotalea nanhaiensis TaxID=3065648 RepID=A0ABY9TFG5_9GAMM|nr:hypothetical protein RI845_13260 [Colwelliaceae bacterium SQ345]